MHRCAFCFGMLGFLGPFVKGPQAVGQIVIAPRNLREHLRFECQDWHGESERERREREPNRGMLIFVEKRPLVDGLTI